MHRHFSPLGFLARKPPEISNDKLHYPPTNVAIKPDQKPPEDHVPSRQVPLFAGGLVKQCHEEGFRLGMSLLEGIYLVLLYRNHILRQKPTLEAQRGGFPNSHCLNLALRAKGEKLLCSEPPEKKRIWVLFNSLAEWIGHNCLFTSQTVLPKSIQSRRSGSEFKGGSAK